MKLDHGLQLKTVRQATGYEAPRPPPRLHEHFEMIGASKKVCISEGPRRAPYRGGPLRGLQPLGSHCRATNILSVPCKVPFKVSPKESPLSMDAAFLLVVGSFLLTVELFDLQLAILAFLLTIEAFFASAFSFLLTV